MFIPNEETQTYWFNHKSQDHTQFELLGVVIGLAIYNGIILDLKFPAYVYKKLLLKNDYSLEDLKSVNLTLYTGLKHVVEYNGKNIEEDYGLVFQITYDYFETKETYDLLPNGQDIPVTNENRMQYVQLYLDYLLRDSVSVQINDFVKGFKEVCNAQAFDLFTPCELQLIVCGSPNLDFLELEKCTKYENGFTNDDPTIIYFWEIVHAFSMEQKKEIIVFLLQAQIVHQLEDLEKWIS